jgi:hypothetical protein
MKTPSPPVFAMWIGAEIADALEEKTRSAVTTDATQATPRARLRIG